MSSVKEFRVHGRRYVYHRASGAPLPDLPIGDPDFIRAFLLAESNHRNAIARPEQKLTTVSPTVIQSHEPPVSPDAIIYTTDQIISWVHTSSTSEVCYYHFGSLLTDSISEHVAQKRAYTMLLADFGALTLRQRRVSEGINHYYAIRTSEPLRYMPQNVLTGTVSADEYSAVVAIAERQSAKSVARSIRDALGVTDDVASQIRNGFIRKGWLTNGRPPQLTELGLSVLI